MTLAKGFVGGVLAGTATSLVAAVARALGLGLNIELVLGSALTEQTGVFTWVLGFLVHLLFSGLVGFLYGIVVLMMRRSGPVVGAGLGLVHLVVDGIAVGWLGGAHPLMPALLADPGAFYVETGTQGAVVFGLMHLLFGALVGSMLAPTRSRAPVAPDGARETVEAPAMAPSDAHA